MGCLLTIFPNKYQSEQTEMFKTCYHIHESLTFMRSITMTFSHPILQLPPCKWSAAGLSQIQGHVVSLQCQEASFHDEANKNLKSEPWVSNHACWGSLLISFLIFLVLCYPRGWWRNQPGRGFGAVPALLWALEQNSMVPSSLFISTHIRTHTHTQTYICIYAHNYSHIYMYKYIYM